MATTGTAGSSLPAIGGTSSSSLSSWAGPYVTNMLGQAQAIANTPYQTYQGPMTAGESPLQSQAFQGIGSLTVPTGFGQAAQTAGDVAQEAGGLFYEPSQFTTGTFGTQEAEQYMNPYLQASLDPQIAEAQRQAEIGRVGAAGRMSQAGAYGGSRQAIMESEGQRNLNTQLAGITGAGYNTAYQNAMQQFNADQARQMQAQQGTEQSRQYGAGYGLDALQQQLAGAQAQGALAGQELGAQSGILASQLGAGQQQRGIEQEGITADYNEFLAQRDYPMKQTQYLQSMLQGLPIATTTNTAAQQSGLGQVTSAVGGIGSLLEALKKLGIGK